MRLSLIILTISVFIASAEEYELDFLQTFFVKNDHLTPTNRLNKLGQDWLKGTGYEKAVGITIDNWTNNKLEFPELTITDGAVDRWLKPDTISRHTSDISLLAHGLRGGGTKGSVSYLIEDSWPRDWVSIGWHKTSKGVDVILALGKTHLNYDDLLRHESLAQTIEDGVRFFKASDKFVLTVSCSVQGDGHHMLRVSVLPQSMDFWAWEKYYKQPAKLAKSSTVQKIDISPTKLPEIPKIVPFDGSLNPELENEQGVFERKDLLMPGRSKVLQGDKTAREMLSKLEGSVAAAISIENWSRFPLDAPSLVDLKYGVQSDLFPLRSVESGRAELAILKQSGGLTGVSGIIRWPIGDDRTVLSLMISVPYNPDLYGTWVAVGLFRIDTPEGRRSMPNFDAMYYGTPDSAWYIRHQTGDRLEFSNEDFHIVLDSDTSLSKPVLKLALLPTNTADGAPTIKLRLAGKMVVDQLENQLTVSDSKDRLHRQGKGRAEGDHSIVSALSSSSSAHASCHCPCLGASRAFFGSKFALISAVLFQLFQLIK